MESLKTDIDTLSNDIVATLLIQYLKGYGKEISLQADTEKELEEIKETYELGLKFKKNQRKKRKKLAFLDEKDEDSCKMEVEIAKMIYSRATYYRRKKAFKQLFENKK